MTERERPPRLSEADEDVLARAEERFAPDAPAEEIDRSSCARDAWSSARRSGSTPARSSAARNSPA